MAKMLKRRTKSKDMDYENYLKGKDRLFDLLREYYIATGEIYTSKWKDICKRDMEMQKARKKKSINDRRNYKIY